jgi:hypothetical protein
MRESFCRSQVANLRREIFLDCDPHARTFFKERPLRLRGNRRSPPANAAADTSSDLRPSGFTLSRGREGMQSYS